MWRARGKAFALLIVYYFLISACSSRPQSQTIPFFLHSTEISEPTSSQSSRVEAPPTKTREVTSKGMVTTTLTYDEEEIRSQQASADQGHLTLNISDPAYAAMDYLSTHCPDFGKVEEPPRYLKLEDQVMAVLEIESTGNVYTVTLEKLARQDDTGVWFVTQIKTQAR